jgi:hypothetical protein
MDCALVCVVAMVGVAEVAAYEVAAYDEGTVLGAAAYGEGATDAYGDALVEVVG